MRKIIPILLMFFIVLTVFVGCGRKTAAKSKEDAIPVKVMKVENKTLHKALSYVGNIKGIDEATVYPKVSGKIIEEAKREGNPVNKGDPILYIDRDEVGLKFEKAPVESPLNGVVGRIYVDIGANVTPQTPVALVANMEKVEINLDIPERYLHQLSLGNKAIIKIDAYPHKEFTGEVTEMSPIVDLETRAAPIEITIYDYEHLLQSGMFAKVKLILEEYKNVPTIMKEAIIGKEPNSYVYVVESDKAVLRKITPGIREDSLVEVKEGLSEGESVVIMGQQRLRDGSIVAAEE